MKCIGIYKSQYIFKKKVLTHYKIYGIIIIESEREVISMKTQKELKRELDNWYSEYCKDNGHAPTVAELFAKANELGLDKI